MTCISANIMDDDILFCAPLALDDPANVWCLPPARMWWANKVLMLRNELSKASRELAALEDSFRLHPPKEPVAPGNPSRQLVSFDTSWYHVMLHVIPVSPSFWMDDAPANGYQLKDSLQFKCDVGVLAHSLASLHLLCLQWDGVGVQMG